MRDTDREREAETQAEGEAGSPREARCGTQFWILGSGPEPKADTQLLSHPGIPIMYLFKCQVFVIHLCVNVPNKNSLNPYEWNPVFPISIVLSMESCLPNLYSPFYVSIFKAGSIQTCQTMKALGRTLTCGLCTQVWKALSVCMQGLRQMASAHSTPVGQPIFSEHPFATHIGKSLAKFPLSS